MFCVFLLKLEVKGGTLQHILKSANNKIKNGFDDKKDNMPSSILRNGGHRTIRL